MIYPVAKPDVSGNEAEYVNEAIRDGIISSQGGFIKEFENKFAKYHGMDYGIACSSGTAALILSLSALNITKRDEVIIPEFTFVATANAVSFCGAKPIFIDCGEDLNIDASKIEDRISVRTKAVIPVHIYGRQCDMEGILKLSRKYKLFVIEDSCESHGIKPKGDIACFSLFANKIITSGEGGICLTNNKNLAERMKHLRNCAQVGHTYYHTETACNFRMTNLQGAVALAQTERLEEFLMKRRQIEEWYDEGLKDVPRIKLMPKRDAVWMYDLLADNRDGLIKHLEENGIEARMFFKPMSSQPMYKKNAPKDSRASQISKNGLCLPTFTGLTREDIKYITSKIKEFYAR